MSKTFDPDRSLGVLISDIARLLRRNMDRRLQSLGLTQAQWRAIVHLSRSEGMTQAALAESLEIQPITSTRLIDRMQSAGWVERRNAPARSARRAAVSHGASRSRSSRRCTHAPRNVETTATRGLSRRARSDSSSRRSSRSSRTSSPRKPRRSPRPNTQEGRIVMAGRRAARSQRAAPAPSAADPRKSPRPRLRFARGAQARRRGCARRCCCWARSSR